MLQISTQGKVVRNAIYMASMNLNAFIDPGIDYHKDTQFVYFVTIRGKNHREAAIGGLPVV